MVPITKPMVPSDPAGMSNFQSCNYHILQNNLEKLEKSIYFMILGYEQYLKISALKSKFKTKMDM